MNITVKRAQASEIEEIIKLDTFFPHPWKADAWKNLNENMHCFIVKESVTPIGFTLFQHVSGDDQSHLLKIYLQPDFRKSGLAAKLFETSCEEIGAKEVFLEVGESNVAAQRFYEKIGFNKVHLAKNFYSDGESAWLMLLAR